mmetsp:Transcript_41213/g.61007  ORF Transcript_41213/g.61007 Transcript_41213/m.61007 type:complete len:93 (+) Transcript_41213:275-553(+)
MGPLATKRRGQQGRSNLHTSGIRRFRHPSIHSIELTSTYVKMAPSAGPSRLRSAGAFNVCGFSRPLASVIGHVIGSFSQWFRSFKLLLPTMP